MTNRLAPILVSRRPRHAWDDWTDAGSWFGGRPRLGGARWPRGESGRSLVFVAQLDLAAIAAVRANTGLPRDGALAFFVGEAPGAVVFIPPGADTVPTAPPDDAIFAYERGGDLFPANPSPFAYRCFPYWPIEFTALHLDDVSLSDIEDDESIERLQRDMADAVSAKTTRREYFFTAKEAAKAIGGPVPYFWHAAHLLVEFLRIAHFHQDDYGRVARKALSHREATVARLAPPPARTVFGFGFGRKPVLPDPAREQANAALRKQREAVEMHRRQKAAFPQFIAEVEAFAAQRDPILPMTTTEAAALAALIARAQEEFDTIAPHRVPDEAAELATTTMLDFFRDDKRGFRALPIAYRELINTQYLLPTQAWHQMFGIGVDIQGGFDTDQILLLQLCYDDMVDWRFGDMGAYQFAIAPADLADRTWSAVSAGFEAH